MGLFLLLFSAAVWAQVSTSDVVGVEAITPGALSPGSAAEVRLKVDILPGWHINAHSPSQEFLIPTTLVLSLPPGFRVEEEWPPPETRTLRFSQKPLELYEGVFEVILRVHVGEDVAPGDYTLTGEFRYQACNDEVCLPPASVPLEIPLTIEAGPGGAPGVPGAFARGFLWALGAAFLVGLGLNLTPCVYPMVPVTVAYFAKAAGERSGRTLLLALAYLLGIALTYSALGTLAALGGGLLGMALQHPAVLAFLAAVMVALALSFFGVYTLRAPAALLRRLPRSQKGLLSALLMGAVVGVVAAPCVGPATVAFISYVASLGDPFRGFLLFFVLALGLGMPYVGLALLSGRLRSLPKPGPWTVWVEHLLGVFLLGLALYFLSPILPEAGLKVGIFVLAGGGGAFLFISALRRKSRAVLALGALAALAGFAVGTWQVVPRRGGEEIPWTPYSASVLEEAGKEGKPVVLYFSAEWCLPCKELSATTFRHHKVREKLQGFVPVKVDLTEVSADEEEVRRRFGVVGVPTVVFLSPEGEEMGRLFGFFGVEEFLGALEEAYGE